MVIERGNFFGLTANQRDSIKGFQIPLAAYSRYHDTTINVSTNTSSDRSHAIVPKKRKIFHGYTTVKNHRR